MSQPDRCSTPLRPVAWWNGENVITNDKYESMKSSETWRWAWEEHWKAATPLSVHSETTPLADVLAKARSSETYRLETEALNNALVAQSRAPGPNREAEGSRSSERTNDKTGAIKTSYPEIPDNCFDKKRESDITGLDGNLRDEVRGLLRKWWSQGDNAGFKAEMESLLDRPIAAEAALIGEVVGHESPGRALVDWYDNGLRPIGMKLYAHSASMASAWVPCSERLPSPNATPDVVLGWFPGMKVPDVFPVATVRRWQLDPDPIPGAKWMPLPVSPEGTRSV
jgi:hypothetical protein